jgi:xanthine dehydrogenase YagT iron-sulfur-binding subunit
MERERTSFRSKEDLDVNDPRTPNDATGVSRREFLRGSAMGALAAGLAAGAATEAASSTTAASSPASAVLGPGKVPIELRVNGKTLSVELEPRVTLLDALRNHLDLTGAKKVCDRSTCGACTVIVDHKAVYACTLLAIEAQGSDIQTVEGLGAPGSLHPLQAAFVEHDAQQCGFCTPGFVMACKALLDKSAKPTADQIVRGLGGNLCRCGTYAGIRKAVLAQGGQGNG